MKNHVLLNTSIFGLLSFFIQKSIALNEILPENQFRIELMAVHDFLWHEIEKNQITVTSSMLLLKTVVQYHDHFLFSNNSLFMQNTTKIWMDELSQISQWIEIENESSMISDMFQDFLDVFANTRDEDIDDGTTLYIYNFVEKEIIPNADFLNEFLDKIHDAMDETFRIVIARKHYIFNVSFFYSKFMK